MVTTTKPKAILEKHPYMSGTAGLMQATAQLRKQFPSQVTADTLKKLAIAPNNETYVLNILRFVGVLDASGNKTSSAVTVFNQHEDGDFQKGFAELVKTAYEDLFGLHGEDSWGLPPNKLISFFRNTDHTSAIVGQRQASTFQALATLSGRLDKGTAKTQNSKSSQPKAEKKVVSALPKKPSALPKGSPAPATSSPTTTQQQPANVSDVGLTVRIEINLPAGGDQETYDRIFKSIRENLLNAKAS